MGSCNIGASLFISAQAFSQVPNYVPTTGLVGWWPFNGNANDESGNGNNGTVNGAMLTADRFGNSNSAYSFNYLNWTWGAGGDYIYIPFSSMFNTPNLTVSVWFNIYSLGYNNSGVTIITRFENGYSNPGGETWQLWYNSNDLLSSKVIQGGNGNFQPNVIANGSSVDFNEWINITFTYDGQYLSHYENGVLISLVPSNNLLLNTAGNSGISLGMSIQANGHWGPYDGKLDDVGIWSRALSQQEITALYNGCGGSSLITQPTNQSVNPTNTAQFSVSSTPGSLFQWQTDLGLGFQNVSNAGQYSGANTDTLFVSNVSGLNNNQQFRCIVNSGNCADTSEIAVLTVSTLGIEEIMNQPILTLYPNPTQSSFEIQTNLVYTKIQIRDMQGRIVKTENAGKTIHIASVQKGTYLVELLDETSRVIAAQKMIKE